ncbi:hypothetical protein [Mesorhizobium sp. B2-8-9]|uniref:hypothetical protein n=1 Tax=Mesorhizobium sp. B2-8-9 TaxID=2589899 RepID=UPI00112E0248|nr:hypothetical protein [Mesorhizobium sp. B2-8-9]TPI86406.1 hypothetical protein FJ423_00865 [Mesorhizobium sp. B2-8-9]
MLTEKRKADRLQMAAEMEKLIVANGATFERVEGGTLFPGPRAIHLNIKAARGLQLLIDLDGDSVQPDIHVLSWHFSGDTDACFADAFSGRFGTLNNYHWRKATYIAEGFQALCLAVEYGLTLARDGRAFDAAREAVHIAENGTAAERKKRWDIWREEFRAECEARKQVESAA